MAEVRIDLKALCHNYQRLKSLAPQSKTLAVVKANAYGHGLLEVATALSNTQQLDGFAIARIEEALFLREQGFTETIVLLDGVFTVDDMQAAYQHNITLVLHHMQQCQLLADIAWQENTALTLWIKVNTGMNRLGFAVEDLPTLKQQLSKYQWAKAQVLMTHLANADSGNLADQVRALDQFETAKQSFPSVEEYSIANSAALICYKETHANWNRPGIGLYGACTLSVISSQQNSTSVQQENLPLKAVMHFSAPIIAINTVQVGETVGYGSIGKVTKTMSVAVIGAGYGDGYPRHAKQGTPVSIAGKSYPLIGRVSMDMITIDVSSAKQTITIGDEAVLWGDVNNVELSVDNIAECAETIGYELLCGISSRVKRKYFNG